MFADICSVLCYVSRFVMESSYVPVESLIFGRLAYKGMNAEIESLMLELRSTRLLDHIQIWYIFCISYRSGTVKIFLNAP